MENIGLALTNLLLALVFMLYAKYSWQVATPIPLLKNNITWLYASISFVFMLSFMMFGFYNMPEGEMHGYIKQIILLSSGLILYFTCTILLTIHHPSKPRKIRALLLMPAFIYTLLTFQWPTFFYTNLLLIPCLMLLGYDMAKMCLQNKNRQILVGAISVFLLIFLILFQDYLANINTPFFFMLYTPLVIIFSFLFYRGMALFLNQSTHTGLYHIIANNNLNALTSTSVIQVFTPKTIENAQENFKEIKKNNQTMSFQSSGYAIGGQQLGENSILINTKKMNKVVFFDSVNGIIKVGPSMSWYQLLNYLSNVQKKSDAWAPTQLPTHFLDYSIGGAVSANIHGNGFFSTPLIKNIESIDFLDVSGEIQCVNRKTDQALFSLLVGGYGLFGLMTGIELKLSKKRMVKSSITPLKSNNLEGELNAAAQSGCLYFEYLLNTNQTDQDYLQTGILSTYYATDADPKKIKIEPYYHSIFNKNTLKNHSHLLTNNKTKKTALQYKFLLDKNDRYYWSDNIIPYFPLEKNLKTSRLLFSEYKEYHLIKQEYYIPVKNITSFLTKLRLYPICQSFDLVQAKLSLTKQDNESFLFWSNQDYVAIELDFHADNSMQSIILLKAHLTKLTELAIHHQGGFNLSYTPCYEKKHLLACYPQIIDFLNLKLKYDPNECFQSNWYQEIKNIVYDLKSDIKTTTLDHDKKDSAIFHFTQ